MVCTTDGFKTIAAATARFRDGLAFERDGACRGDWLPRGHGRPSPSYPQLIDIFTCSALYDEIAALGSTWHLGLNSPTSASE